MILNELGERVTPKQDTILSLKDQTFVQYYEKNVREASGRKDLAKTDDVLSCSHVEGPAG